MTHSVDHIDVHTASLSSCSRMARWEHHSAAVLLLSITAAGQMSEPNIDWICQTSLGVLIMYQYARKSNEHYRLVSLLYNAPR